MCDPKTKAYILLHKNKEVQKVTKRSDSLNMKKPQQLLAFLKSLSFTEAAGSVTQDQCTKCINSIIYQLILWSLS